MGAHPDSFDPQQLIGETAWLRGFAKVLAKGEADAEDVAQAAVLRSFESPPARGGDLRGWLKTVARNVWHDTVARRARRSRHEARAARREALAEERLVERVELHRAVVEAVLALDEPYRSTVILRFVEGLPPREVARRQGVPVATVRTRTTRALATLRAKLDRRYGDRSSWCLVALSKLGTGAAALTASGAIVMTIKSKLAAAAVLAIAVAGAAWWQTRESEPPASIEHGGAPHSGPGGGTSAPVTPTDPPQSTQSVEASHLVPTEGFRERAAPAFVVTGTVVDARDGSPVGDAQVTAMTSTDDPSGEGHATTDAAGEFEAGIERRVTILAVMVEHPGFAPLIARVETPTDPYAGRVDAGELRLERGALVRGRVSWRESGRPVAGAQLRLLPLGSAYGYQPLRSAREVGRSRDDGSFELSERVIRQRRGLSPPELFAFCEEGIGWTPIEVVAGRELLDDIQIVVERGGAIEAQVTDDASRPVPGLDVSAIPRFSPIGVGEGYGPVYWQAAHSDPRFFAKTDAEGIVRFTGLPFGTYEDRFTDGSRPKAYDLFIAATAGFLSARTRVTLLREGTTSVRVVLDRATGCTLFGRVLDDAASAIAGATIACPQHSKEAVATDEIGEFRLPGNTGEGRLVFEVRAAGFAMLREEVTLAGGSKEHCHDFKLERATPVSGRVIDEQGQPVANAGVGLHRQEGRTLRFTAPASPQTDVDGRFEFPDATAGAWTLGLSSVPGEDWVHPRDRTVSGGDRDLTIVLRKRREAKARIVAEVIDVTTRAPLDPVEARIRREAAIFSGDGYRTPRFECSVGRVSGGPIETGSWILELKVRDRGLVWKPFRVGPEDLEIRLVVEVGGPATITGRIDFGSEPAEALPDRFMLMPEPNFAAKWDRRGGTFEKWIGNGVLVDAKTDWTFRMIDVIPDLPVRLRIASETWCGSVELSVASGTDAKVVIRAVRGGRVTWTKAQSAQECGLVLTVQAQDGSWQHVERANWDRGQPWSSEVAIPPGRHGWKAERFDLDAPVGERKPVAVAEGWIEARAGEAQTVEIEFR